MSSRSIDRGALLPPEVNRIIYVRNLPFKVTSEEMYKIFGRYGPIRQVRLGNTATTQGTAFVIYQDIYDAKTAVEALSGFNVGGRYIVCLYYQARRAMAVGGKEEKMKAIDRMKQELEDRGEEA